MKTAKEIIKGHIIESIMTERKVNRDEAELLYEDGHEDTLMMEKHVTEMMKAYAEQAIDECVKLTDITLGDVALKNKKAYADKQSVLNVKNLLK